MNTVRVVIAREQVSYQEAVSRSALLSAYARATRCPVLTARTTIPSPALCLRACYALSGTDLACGRPRFDVEVFADMVQECGANLVRAVLPAYAAGTKCPILTCRSQVVFTTTWAGFYFPAPIAAIDRIIPGLVTCVPRCILALTLVLTCGYGGTRRTTSRDLVAEMSEALHSRGQHFVVWGQWSMVNGQWSRVKGQGSRVKGLGSRVKGQGSRVKGQGSEVKSLGSRALDMWPYAFRFLLQ
eukprot:919335-Rhodomonas_salina.1